MVADEVRSLATRSHESTQEIESIVEQLQLGAQDAVAVMTRAKQSAEARRGQVETADSALNLIAGRVTRIREFNAQMATAAHQQSTVTRDVARNVVTISQLAERTTLDAEETTAVSKRLMALADQLEGMVQRFRY